MSRQSITKAQKRSDTALPSQSGLFQRKKINRKDYSASTVDTRNPTEQQIDKPSLPSAESHFNHDFSKIPVRLNTPYPVQAKLKIGQPDDKYEQEADRVAERVMRMADPGLSSSDGNSSLANSTIPRSGTIQRACASCSAEYKTAEDENRPVQPANLCPKCRTQEQGLIQTKQITRLIQRQESLMEQEEEDEELIQTKATGGITPEVTPAISSGIQSLQGGGRPLSGSERSFYEPRFGTDFSNVRVHNDARAANAAQSVNARAFTLGQNVVFASGEYAPDALSGRKLLAHELTHVVQQTGEMSLSSMGKAINKINLKNNSTLLPIIPPKLNQVVQQKAPHEISIQRKVNSPAADLELKNALVGQLGRTGYLPASSASFFFNLMPPQASDPLKATAKGWSEIETLLKTINRLHWTILKDLNQVPDKPSRHIPAPPAGEVKLALLDVPKGPSLRIIELTADDLNWNIEVLVPKINPGGKLGRQAVEEAFEQKRIPEIQLVTHRVLQHVKIARPEFPNGCDRPHCTPVPPHRVQWKTSARGLHIDAGGKGVNESNSPFFYPGANNLNCGGSTKSKPIPNLVCGDVNKTWPIADRRADLITVNSTPINPVEIARVIKTPGRILISSTPTELMPDLPKLIRLLGNRLEKVETWPPPPKMPEDAKIDVGFGAWIRKQPKGDLPVPAPSGSKIA